MLQSDKFSYLGSAFFLSNPLQHLLYSNCASAERLERPSNQTQKCFWGHDWEQLLFEKRKDLRIIWDLLICLQSTLTRIKLFDLTLNLSKSQNRKDLVVENFPSITKSSTLTLNPPTYRSTPFHQVSLIYFSACSFAQIINFSSFMKFSNNNLAEEAE